MLFRIYSMCIIKNHEKDDEHTSIPFALPVIEANSKEAVEKWLKPFKGKPLNQYPFLPCSPKCIHKHEFNILPLETFKIPE